MLFPFSLSGGADDAHGNQTELEAALNEGNAGWETTRYSGVEHGFTKWDDADGYDLVADYRSWESMKHAFEEKMPVPTKAGMGETDNSAGSAEGESAALANFASFWSLGLAAVSLVAQVVL